MRYALSAAAIGLGGLLASPATAEVRITIENLNPDGSLFLTPFWVGLHNGGFDSYDGGTLASMWPGLTAIAEEGDTGPISKAFAASPAGGAGGVQTTVLAVSGKGDAPVLNPGESVTMILDPGNASVNRYFSYASMIIPSNDLFVANGNPLAHQIFDEDGNFLCPVTIEISGSAINDNGTEVNDIMGGAAFSAEGGKSVDEKVVIRSFFTLPEDEDYLGSLIGTQTVTGFTIESAPASSDVIARITIEEVPACPEDLNGNGEVEFGDLLQVLTAWGPCS